MRRVLLLAALTASACFVLQIAGQEPSAAPWQSFDQLLQAAETARDANRNDEAIWLFRRALEEQPESEQALWYLGTMLYEKEQYAEARDVLRQFATLRPDAGPAWALLGLSEFQLRQYSRALDHLQRAMAQGMGDRKELIQSVYYEVVVLLTRFERYDDSIVMLQRMLANGVADPALTEPAGLAALRLPFLPAEIPPDRRELVHLTGRATLDVQTQHYEDAETEFKQLVTKYPNEPGIHYLYGAYLVQLHPDESVAEFERELEISPSHVLARVRLAEQLISQHDFDRALALAQQAIKLDPKRASAHMLAGEALLAKGNAGDGIKELETARDIDPTVVRAHWDLLRAYIAAGRNEDADREKKTIEKLSDLNSQSRPGDARDNARGRAAP
ncbi:MAG: tetratricopeptide repeat protein [Terracidiphilus sp.]|jgi:tetratricopeptide (TPR) repeat protein